MFMNKIPVYLMSGVICFSLGFFARGFAPSSRVVTINNIAAKECSQDLVNPSSQVISSTPRNSVSNQKPSLHKSKKNLKASKPATERKKEPLGFSSEDAEREADEMCERFKEMRRNDPVMRHSREEVALAFKEQEVEFKRKVSEFFQSEYDKGTSLLSQYEQINSDRDDEMSALYEEQRQKTDIGDGVMLHFSEYEDHEREFLIYQRHHQRLQKLLGPDGLQKLAEIIKAHNLQQIERVKAGMVPGETINF